METLRGLQQAVDFVEDNLTGEPTLEQIVSASGYSAPHFHRVFRAVTGFTAMGYLRRRRLSEALSALTSAGEGILDVALRYGFGSHEAFTRAFREVYGAPPSRVRRSAQQPLPFERIHLIHRKGENIMNPTIREKEAITLVGICRTMTQAENLRDGLIGQVRREFLAQAATLTDRLEPDKCYAAYDYKPEDIAKEDDKIRYTYWFCARSDATPPKGMRRKQIAAAKYAEFVHDPANNTLNGEPLTVSVYDYIDGVWLPASGLELSGLPDYEVHHLSTSVVEIYVSVK